MTDRASRRPRYAGKSMGIKCVGVGKTDRTHQLFRKPGLDTYNVQII